MIIASLLLSNWSSLLPQPGSHRRLPVVAHVRWSVQVCSAGPHVGVLTTDSVLRCSIKYKLIAGVIAITFPVVSTELIVAGRLFLGIGLRALFAIVCPHTSANSRTRKSEVNTIHILFSLELKKEKSFIKPIPKCTIYRYTVYLNTNIRYIVT